MNSQLGNFPGPHSRPFQGALAGWIPARIPPCWKRRFSRGKSSRGGKGRDCSEEGAVGWKGWDKWRFPIFPARAWDFPVKSRDLTPMARGCSGLSMGQGFHNLFPNSSSLLPKPSTWSWSDGNDASSGNLPSSRDPELGTPSFCTKTGFKLPAGSPPAPVGMTGPGLSALAQVLFPWIFSMDTPRIQRTCIQHCSCCFQKYTAEGKAGAGGRDSSRILQGTPTSFSVPHSQLLASNWITHNSLIVIPCSQFLIHNSLLAIPCSEFPTHNSLLTIPASNSLLRIPCWQFLAPSSLLVPPVWHHKCPGNPSLSQREKKPLTPVQKDFIHGINPWSSWECHLEAPLTALLQLGGRILWKKGLFLPSGGGINGLMAVEMDKNPQIFQINAPPLNPGFLKFPRGQQWDG